MHNISDICKTLCEEILDSIETMLKKEPLIQIEYESTEIKCPIEIVWEFIVNFEFLKIKQASNIKFDGEIGKVGTIISWQFNFEDGEKEQCKAKIIEVSKKPGRKKWTFSIIPLEHPVKNQAIKFGDKNEIR
jgi:hypothetical protein